MRGHWITFPFVINRPCASKESYKYQRSTIIRVPWLSDSFCIWVSVFDEMWMYAIFGLIAAQVVVFALSSCPEGTYLNNKKCLLCPPGTYRFDLYASNDRCTPCPAGTFSPYYGVGTVGMCLRCPPNTYSAQNATSCEPCPSNSVSEEGSQQCLSCKPGTYPVGTRYGNGKCIDCIPGTYRENKNESSCKSCPSGLSSPGGAKSLSECYECPAGREARFDYQSGCGPCSVGFYKPSTSKDECKRCPNGFIASTPGTTSCTACPIGTRSNTYSTRCIPCPDGYTTYSKGQSVCRKIGNACPPYTIEGPQKDCLKCRLGQFLSDTFECTPCPLGSRSLGGIARSCIKCPGRQESDVNLSYCRCPPGEYFATPGICTKCPRGTYLNNNIHVIGKPECVRCEGAGIAPNRGSALCEACPRGMIANNDATKCVKCTHGLVPRDGACVNVTTGCPLGHGFAGEAGDCFPIMCKLDTPAADVGKVCLPCSKGYAFLNGGKQCQPCPDGYVSDGGMITKCRKCANGLQKDVYDGSVCSCTVDGYGMQNGTCAKCPAGYYGEYKESFCRECEPGTFTSSSGRGYCDKCPKGTFKSKSGAGKCQPCAKGLIGSKKEGAVKCIEPY